MTFDFWKKPPSMNFQKKHILYQLQIETPPWDFDQSPPNSSQGSCLGEKCRYFS